MRVSLHFSVKVQYLMFQPRLVFFLQVSEEMVDQANEKKMEAINAQGEGALMILLRNWQVSDTLTNI